MTQSFYGNKYLETKRRPNICLGGDDNIQREKDGIIVVLQYAKQDGRKYIRDTFGGRKGITMTI